MNARIDSYHTLRARHEAMRLRRQMLSPTGPERPAGSSLALIEVYDGAADKRIVLEHLDAVEPLEELITHLYRALFARHPSMRAMFPASMAFQQAHLAAAFRYLIDHLDQPAAITGTFARLGREHRKLGLLPGQYTAFESALREALRSHVGRYCTTELEQAWVRMLRAGVDAMVRGADEALHEPPFWSATVTEHELRAPDLAVLRVRPHEEYRFRGGQHIAVESSLLPHTWRRFYPVAVPGGEGELELHIRCTGPGGVSEALVRGTGPGDVLRIGPPEGNLDAGDPTGAGVLLVAWDTGWAAMKALLRDLESSRSRPGRVRLFVGAEVFFGFYDADCLAGLERHRSWLTVVPVTGGRPGEDPHDRLVQAVTAAGPVTADRALVAGPPAPVRAITAALADAGLEPEQVLHDLPPGIR
ncbi:oxidoreductase [Streptomyces sp. NBRC 14336]|uniref:globin domain-containing protein n=1 Tax=Streptomyces sp. NBRC 14336 TaxID=3030992 RepID=UPI00249F9F7A|nr:globin domain-containing protein [Streptomyces sp. NBRC 14336]GLW49497.1 oxidoreductase [Streptomyces sp. NBRC 14336]